MSHGSICRVSHLRLDESTTYSILEQVAADGKRRKMKFYNLDMIIVLYLSFYFSAPFFLNGQGFLDSYSAI